MAIYVYTAATGVLYSYCPNDSDPVADPATLKAKGLTATTGLPALTPTHQWDPATKTVAIVAATELPNFIPAYLFVNCFTGAETVAIQASTDPLVKRFLLMLSVAQQVNLNDPTVQNGVGYLGSIGLIAKDRVPQILAGQVQPS
jgi:hypothetical protein